MGAPQKPPAPHPHQVLDTLKAFDAFPKVNEDFFHKTMSGGIITVVAYAFMLMLFITETRLFLTVQTSHELAVDSSRGETIRIDVDVTFPRMPCSWLSLDAMDVSGELHLDVEHDIYKQRLARNGAPVSQAERHVVAGPRASAAKANGSSSSTGNAAAECGTCYGAEDAEHPCCNTCDQVRAAYQSKGWVMLKLSEVTQCADDEYLGSVRGQEGEGCRMWGRLDVHKVAGNFHFAGGRSFQQGNVHIHDMAPFAGKALDFTHTINRLSFGPQYPGITNPLEGVSSLQGPGGGGGARRGSPKTGMYQYFLKVVPTIYVDRGNKTLASNQYSVTENFRESTAGAGSAASKGQPSSSSAAAAARALPGVFFFYDLSPIKVHIVESRPSFLHYLTNLCAIVGGVFAVSGLLDGAVHQGERIIRKKMNLGKFI